jgi:hypothetical protein
MYRLWKSTHEFLCSLYVVNVSLCIDYVWIMFVPLDYAEFFFAEFSWNLSYKRIMAELWIALELLIHNLTENAFAHNVGWPRKVIHSHAATLLVTCGCISSTHSGGAGNAGCGGGGGRPGINFCVVGCASVKTGVAVVLSRHKEKRPGCSFI